MIVKTYIVRKDFYLNKCCSVFLFRESKKKVSQVPKKYEAVIYIDIYI